MNLTEQRIECGDHACVAKPAKCLLDTKSVNVRKELADFDAAVSGFAKTGRFPSNMKVMTTLALDNNKSAISRFQKEYKDKKLMELMSRYRDAAMTSGIDKCGTPPPEEYD